MDVQLIAFHIYVASKFERILLVLSTILIQDFTTLQLQVKINTYRADVYG